jgi:hypothetical protein
MNNFIAIKKYGCYYDPETQETCPMISDGTPDITCIDHIDDMECEEELQEEIKDEINAVIRRLHAYLYIGQL